MWFSDPSGDPSGNPTEPASRGRLAAVSLLFVVALTAIPYLRALGYGFVYDDEAQIVNNAAIRGWDAVPSYFLTSIGGLFDPGASHNFYYRPLFVLFLRINHALFGLNPLGWHFSALGVHLVATALVLFLLRFHFHDFWIPIAGALIFGLHPVHIESVVWVSGMTDSLAAVGMLGSLLLWTRSRESPCAAMRMGALALFATALLTKETAIVFPGILFVYALAAQRPDSSDKSSAGRRIRSAVWESLPFAVLAILYLALRAQILPMERTAAEPWFSAVDTILTAPSLLVFYLRQLIWPRGLSLYYDFPVVTTASLEGFWLPLAVLCGLAACAWAIGRASRDAGAPAAMIWLAAPLLPVLNLQLFQPDDFVHDRYLYLPSIGGALAAALLFSRFTTTGTPLRARRVGTAGVVFLLAGFGISTAIQAAPWRDNLSLYTRAVERSPNNPMAWNNLAAQYVERERFAEAARIFEAILAKRPDFWLANYNYGYLNYRSQRYDRAEQFLRRAIALNPQDADAHSYLALTYFRQNRLAEAAARLRDAIARRPNGTGYHLALGIVLLQQGDREGARTEFATELKFHPENSTARAQLELLESLSGQSEP